MKQRKLLNGRLYLDMLRQLMLMGCILAAACILITLLPPLVYAVTWSTTANVRISIEAVTPALWGFLYLGGAGLVYLAFSWLNHRNACDCYYSLPNTARTMWLSTFAAVATWIVGIVTATVTLGYLGYAAAGIALPMAYFPKLIAYFAIGTLQVAAATTVAVSLTGTRFSNLVVTALILFLPRFLLTMVGIGVLERSKMIPASELSFLLNPRYNIAAVPLTLFDYLMNGESIPELIGFGWGDLYSAVLTLLYAAAGLVLHEHRRAETAGSSAPCRMLQHIYRSALTIPFLSVLAFAAAASYERLLYYMSHHFAITATLVLVAALCYFAYELMTSKRFKNLLTTLPLFLVLIFAVPALLYGGTVWCTDLMQRKTVQASEIESIRIDVTDLYDVTTYERLLLREVAIQNEELNELVETAWKRTIACAEANQGRIYPNDESEIGNTCKVTISTGSRSFTRNLYFTPAELRTVETILATDADCQAAGRILPKAEEVTFCQLVLDGERYSLNGDEDYQWTDYLEELSAYSGAEYDAAMTEDPYQGVLQLRVTGLRNGVRFYAFYPVNAYTPKLFQAAMSCGSLKLQSLRDTLQSLESADETTRANVIISCLNTGSSGEVVRYDGNPLENDALLAAMRCAAESSGAQTAQADSPLICIWWEVTQEHTDSSGEKWMDIWGSETVLVALEPDEAESLMQLLKASGTAVRNANIYITIT